MQGMLQTQFTKDTLMLAVRASLRGVAIIIRQVIPPPGFSVAQSSYHSAHLQGYNYLLEMKRGRMGETSRRDSVSYKSVKY